MIFKVIKKIANKQESQYPFLRLDRPNLSLGQVMRSLAMLPNAHKLIDGILGNVRFDFFVQNL